MPKRPKANKKKKKGKDKNETSEKNGFNFVQNRPMFFIFRNLVDT